MAFLNKAGLEQLWKHIVAKLTSYAPSKSGDGAYGTWGINISGNATKATQDGDGNVIANTYAKKSEIAVNSVNNKTGNIVLTAADVGAVTEEDFITDSKIDEICGESPLGLEDVNY